MLLFLGVFALLLAVIFFIVAKYDENSPLITSLSRKNGYKKLQAFLVVMFLVLTPLGLYLFLNEKQTFIKVAHDDHLHLVNGKVGTVAFVNDNIIQQDVPYKTQWLFWDNTDSENLKVLARDDSGNEKVINVDWQLDTSEEGNFIKKEINATTILNGVVIFDKKGTWKLMFMDGEEKVGTLEMEVSE